MKTARKLTSVVLALVLILSLSVTAFAANPTTGTLQVHGDQLGGKDVTAVLMFTANVKSDDDLIGDGDSVGYELVPAWQEFIDAKLGKGASEDATSEEAYNYVKGLANETLYAFAEAAKDYAKQNGIAGTVVAALEADDTATFTDLAAGYYVVYPDAGSTSVNRGTEAMLVNVPSNLASKLELKSVYPTVEKTVDADGNGSYADDEAAQIGDTVKFQLTSAVPEMSDYKTYQFNFVDTMSAGLTYVPNSTVVTIGGDTVAPSAVTYDPATRVLRVEFDDLKTVPGVVAGETVIVTYQAVVNGNAAVGANTNEAYVEYSNDPDWDGTGTEPTGHSDEDDADVYTFQIIIDKYAKVDGVNVKLANAVFKLKDSTNAVLKLVHEGGNIYHIATAEEIDDPAVVKVEQVTTDANGAVTIQGLEAGTYYLEEVAAPTGYNRLAEDVKIVITADYSGTEAVISYQVDDDEATTSPSIPVENKTGAVLPETGAMGTIGLTIFGVLVVILGVALPRRKNVRA